MSSYKKKLGLFFAQLIKKQIFVYTIRLLLASVAAFALLQPRFDSLEGLLYDLRVRLSPQTSIKSPISLILYDTQSVKDLKGDLKFKNLTELLVKLKIHSPRYLLLNIRLDEVSGTDAEKKEFANLAAQFPNLYVLTDEIQLKDELTPLSLPSPFEKVPVASAPKTIDSKILAKDNVTRRAIVSYQGRSLLHAQVAASVNPEIKDLVKIKNQFEFAGSNQIYIHFHPTGSFPRFSFSQILSQANLPDLKEQIIILGSDTVQSTQDYVLTPFSYEITAMPTAEMHANMIDTMITNSAPHQTHPLVNVLLVFLICILTTHIVMTVKPLRGLILLMSLFVGFSFVSYLLFWLCGEWIKMAPPLLAIFLCYYFFIPYRLIVENRRSWEYYQKNLILKQVEELKGNFISMMSHDLKTPIARIQGMTDVILGEKSPLSPQQQDAVHTIRSSSDDLLKFINAILNYGRIESEGVHLHLQSKDINNLLTEVIKKNEFLAKLKKIKIVSELEPLFPISVDPDLMRQVFSNLLENAIKYSAEETKIMVSTEERDGKIIIQVADQGFGIPTDEIPNIFMKFFRSKNAKSSPIKGSGLGLYLAKYFIELHKGAIFVESTYGQGSTFTVELPLEQGGIHA